jgi:hypothetical protein
MTDSVVIATIGILGRRISSIIECSRVNYPIVDFESSAFPERIALWSAMMQSSYLHQLQSHLAPLYHTEASATQEGSVVEAAAKTEYWRRNSQQCSNYWTLTIKADVCSHITCDNFIYDDRDQWLANYDVGSRCKYESCWICGVDFWLIRRLGNVYHQALCISHLHNHH